jgi:aspartate/methionine/tyrosine aminotransferase
MTDQTQGGTRAAPRRAPKPSQRSEVAPFIAMDVLRDARALESGGQRILHLEVGQPGAPTPEGVRAAVEHTLAEGRIGYTEALGTTPLRDRISRHYRDSYGVEVPASRIVVTTGSSAAFVLSFLAAFDTGDRVALPSPGYPAYANILKAVGLETVWLETDERSRWAPTPKMLDEAAAGGALNGILVASPANPSGTVIEPEQMEALMTRARELGLWFISDEIYHGLTYGAPCDTALQHDDDAIIINSFSKYYCMTGWRIGWMVVPEALVRPIERLAQNIYISPPALSQVAALAAFDCVDELEANKAVYARNREILMEALPRLGFDRVLPMDGAFYAYIDVGRFTNDSGDFAERMLREAGVATTPGLDFDPVRGNRYLRMSFAGPTAEIEEAVDSLERWLKR